MFKNRKILVSVILFLGLSVGCSSNKNVNSQENTQETIEITDAAEHIVNVPDKPQSVAVFDNAQIDNMDALGLGDRITATASSRLPDYLSEYSDIEVAGTLHEIDLEITMATEPELAIVATRSSSSFEALSEFVPTLDFSLTKESAFESMSYNFLELSKIFGKEEKAQSILAALETEKNELAQIAEESEMRALMLMYNEGSLSVFGRDSRFSHVYDDFGFTPADEDIESSNHGMEISYEYIIEQDPDVIFILDRSAAISENESEIDTSSFEENPLIKEITAYQNKQIYYLTPDTWYLSNGGVQAYEQMIADVATVFE